MMKQCKECGVELTEENHYESSGNICNDCRKKQMMNNYTNKKIGIKPKLIRYDDGGKSYYQRHKEQLLKTEAEKLIERKLKVISHYSNGNMKCANPFNLPHPDWCNDINCLQIDHVNGGGSNDRKIRIGSNFYRWLIKHNFPEGFQVLCANCNWIKRFKNKEHKGYWRQDNMCKENLYIYGYLYLMECKL